MVPSGRNPGRLESEIAHTRARMDSILSSLEATLTPGMLFDRAYEYVKNQEVAKRAGKAAGKTAWNQMRNNPLAFAIMGAGVAYWIFGGKDKDRSHARYESHPYDADLADTYVGRPSGTVDVVGAGYEGYEHDERRGMKDRLGERAGDARMRAREKADEARSKAERKAQEARSKVSGVTSRASSSVRGAASNVKAKANDIASGAKSKASDVSRSMKGAYSKAASTGRSAAYKAKDRASRAGSELSSQAREHPFLFAGLAMALTAAIGSLLRPTRREDRLLGPRRDRFFERADEMGARGVEKARDVANKAFEAAHEKVAETDESEVKDAIEAEMSESGDEGDFETTGTVPRSTTFEAGADDEIDRSGSPPSPPELPRDEGRFGDDLERR